MEKRLVIAIYSHPEYYPPTLNALEYLSGIYDSIYLVHRNISGFDWQYPPNVHLVAPMELLAPDQADKAGFVKKGKWFFKFMTQLFSTIRKVNPDTVLIYDRMALLAFQSIYRFIKKPRIIWYHNHDVAEKRYINKWSLNWWAWKSETWVFPKLDIFSLPAVERKDFFPMDTLKGKFFFLPNFPSQRVYGALKSHKRTNNNVVKILYQGSIGPMHGIEEIIPLLREKVAGNDFLLVLKGFVDASYLESLKQLAIVNEVENQLKYIGPSGYRGVVENAMSCDIGIGIHKKNDIMNSTLGTASNKIYEYAAAGMPVLLYDNDHFRASLKSREWVFFTDTSRNSLLECLHLIVNNYSHYSNSARQDFETGLCFEPYFDKVVQYLKCN